MGDTLTESGGWRDLRFRRPRFCTKLLHRHGIPKKTSKEDMSDSSHAARSEAKVSVRGDAWPVVPLAVALLLLHTLGDQTWAYVTAAVVGGIGLSASVIALVECVGAVRKGPAWASAVWVIVVLLASSGAVVYRLMVT
ncbi:hypothetical protein ACFTZK_22730 [Streptomyces decoyicus]|uniref:hypothetical protein n=1 Tax=Streptomyces decoyicus TaxID=249567 RepID=UPI0036309ACE